MCEKCDDGWRFDATDLHTGRVKAVLHPISADWEELFCRTSTGTLTLAAKDVSADDIWPHTTGVYISQVNPDGSREPRWGGYVEGFNGTGGGAVTVALNSVDEFLDHRFVADDDGGLAMEMNHIVSGGDTDPPPGSIGVVVWKPVATDIPGVIRPEFIMDIEGTGGQSLFASVLVSVANLTGKGIPLTGRVRSPAVIDTNTQILWTDFKNIGTALRELIEKSSGVKYRLEHTYTEGGADPGRWSTVMVFSDALGTNRTYTLRSDYEGQAYGLQVDAKDEADRVYGLGSVDTPNTDGGDSGDSTGGGVVMFSVAYDQAENLPEFQQVVNWNDQKIASSLDEQTVGFVQDHRDPVAVPAMTLVGLEWPDVPPPEELVLGDEVGVEIGYGVLTYRGQRATVLGIAWKLVEGDPVSRTVALQPVVRPSTSVRLQTPAVQLDFSTPTDDVPGAVTVDPWPTQGQVVTVTASSLTEISGMQYSKTMPGRVWVHNDEVSARQVKLVDLTGTKKGTVTGSYGFTPATDLPNNGDPETIRIHPDGRLCLADIGDNTNSRSNKAIYCVPEPATPGHKGLLVAQKYPVAFPFATKNAECLLIAPSTAATPGEWLIVTKEAGKARVVSFGTGTGPAAVGTLVKTLLDVEMVSDGTFTNNGQFVLFRSASNQATLVYRVSDWKRVGKIVTPPLKKGESITIEGFNVGACSFLVGSEGVNSPILRVNLPNAFGATCGDPQ